MRTTVLDLESTRLWAEFVLTERGDDTGEDLALARAAALWRRWREHMTIDFPAAPPAAAA